MRSVSDVLQNKGGHAEYKTQDGRDIKIKYLTLKCMSEYENRLQNRAIAKLAAQKAVVPADIFKELFADLMKSIADGTYAFGGEVASKSLTTMQGIADLISVLTDLPPDEALDLLVTDGDGFKAVFDEVVRKSIGSHDDEKADAEGNA